jgi:hypothetical protein
LGRVVAAATDEQISHTQSGPDFDVWEIHKPNVKQPITHYDQIVFKTGDQITIEAGGGVQTGGSGKTWKLYVNPRGPNSDKLYHGLVHIPSGRNLVYPKSPKVKEMDMVRIQDVIKKKQPLKFDDSKKLDSSEPTHLVLGYEDDDYGDNGYWGHDDGTGDQTKGIGPAWLKISILHKKLN